MKKILTSIALLAALLICITACSGSKNPGTEPGGKPQEATVFERLEDMAKVEYRQVSVNVVTTTGSTQLSANYVLTQDNVLYTIEQFNLLPPDGDITGVSPEYKTTVSGSATVDNGKIIILDGSNVTLPSYAELKGSFNFDEDNFENVVVENGTMSADVISPSEFYGTKVNADDMSIEVEYSEAAFVRISVTYQTEHSTVRTVYEFEG